MQEVDNIIRILRETRNAIKEGNSYKIRILSDQTVHTSTIYQDADNIVVAVLIYSISKIIERENYRDMPGWNKFYESLLKNIDLGINSLEKGDIESFRKSEQNIRISISQIDGKLKNYIEDIFKKAKINKASRIYEHGLSIKKTAELLGTDMWDLASYIGQLNKNEIHLKTDIKKRLKTAEEIFQR